MPDYCQLRRRWLRRLFAGLPVRAAAAVLHRAGPDRRTFPDDQAAAGPWRSCARAQAGGR